MLNALEGVMVPTLILTIQKTFGQNDIGVGGFYFFTALFSSLGSFSGGFLTERIGRKIVLLFATLLIGLGILGLSAAPVWSFFLTAGLFAFFGGGVVEGGINGLFLDLYAETQRGSRLNLLHFFYGLGAFTGPFILGQLVIGGANWRFCVAVIGILTLITAALLSLQKIPHGKVAQSGVSDLQKPFTRTELSLLPFAFLATSICLYVAAELGISSWLVKYLSTNSPGLATFALSLFWGGLTSGRLLARFIILHITNLAFTMGCMVFAAISIILAILIPLPIVSTILLGVGGLFFGPIYPMLMTIGSSLYPHRLATLSGSLAGAATLGAVVFPSLIGFFAEQLGLRTGMLGAGFLTIPAAVSLSFAILLSHQRHNPDRRR